tara:strand:+ start:154 stop:369 length:216 start_codon:yes stop_codon:yes gene_type:complete
MQNKTKTEARNQGMMKYKEVSEMTAVPLGTLYCLVFDKKIPHVRLGPRTVRFKREDIQAWLDNGYVKKTLQ